VLLSFNLKTVVVLCDLRDLCGERRLALP